MLVFAWREAWLTDDAFITFRYVEHWTSGKGLVFNLGEKLEGFSNPLFTALLAAAKSIGVGLPAAARGIGLAATTAEAVLLVLVLRRLEIVLPAAAIALVAHGMDRMVHVWATGGLETSLHALLVTGCLAVAVVPSLRRAGPLVVVLVSVSRPEGLLAGAVAAGALVLAAPEGERRVRAIRLANVVLPTLAVFVLVRFLYFGELLPHTFRAKVDGELTRGFGSGYALAFLQRLGIAGWGALPLVALVIAARRGTHRLAMGAAGALVAVHLAFVVAAGGDYLCDFRFLRPALGPLAVLVACAMDRGLRASARDGWLALVGGAGLTAARLAGSFAGTPVFWDAPKAGDHKRVLTVTTADADRHRAALAKVALPSDAQLVDKAGVTGLGHDHRTIDSTGLLSRDVDRDFEPRGDFVEDGRRERFPGHLRYPKVEMLQRERVAIIFPRISRSGPEVPEIRETTGQRRRGYPFVHVVAPLGGGEFLRFFSALSEEALVARAKTRGITLCLRRPFGPVRCVEPD